MSVSCIRTLENNYKVMIIMYLRLYRETLHGRAGTRILTSSAESIFNFILIRGVWRGWNQSHFPVHFFSKSHFAILKSHSHFWFLTFFFPFPVTKSQSQCGLNPIFPGQNLQIPIPILPLQDPLIWGRSVRRNDHY